MAQCFQLAGGGQHLVVGAAVPDPHVVARRIEDRAGWGTGGAGVLEGERGGSEALGGARTVHRCEAAADNQHMLADRGGAMRVDIKQEVEAVPDAA